MQAMEKNLQLPTADHVNNPKDKPVSICTDEVSRLLKNAPHFFVLISGSSFPIFSALCKAAVCCSIRWVAMLFVNPLTLRFIGVFIFNDVGWMCDFICKGVDEICRKVIVAFSKDPSVGYFPVANTRHAFK